MLLLQHEMGPDDARTLNLPYLADLSARDWGLWRTVTHNLVKLRQFATDLDDLTAADRARLAAQLDGLDAALAAAGATPVAAERLALLRSVQRVSAATPGLDPVLKARVARSLQSEESIERQYRALMQDAIARADVAVRTGRPRSLQGLIQEVAQADRRLGTRRVREMAALGRRLEIELQLAKDQRAAFVRWRQVRDQLFAYERRLRPVFDGWASHRGVLRDVRTGTPPRAAALDAAVRRFAAIDATLAQLRPLPEVQDVHSLLQSVVHLTQQGLVLGQRLSVAPNPEMARNASSAISGAELLLAQARAQLVTQLNPRKVR
jgi:hypothetical protein